MHLVSILQHIFKSKNYKTMKYIVILLFLFVPLFSFSQDVIYRNGWGHYIGKEKVTKKQFKQQLAQDPDAFRQFKRAKRLGYTSVGFSVATTAIILANADEDWLGTGNRNMYLVGMSTATVLALIATMEEINAINTYNRNLNPSTRIAPTSNGIGLVYQF